MEDNQRKKGKTQPTRARDLENKSPLKQATEKPSDSGDKQMQPEKTHGGVRSGAGRKAKPQTAFGRWIEASGLTREEVSRRIGVGLSAVSQLALGTVSPGLETIVAIEELTNGEITARVWLAEKNSRTVKTS